MGNSLLKTDIIEVEEGTDSFRIIRCPDNRPANYIFKRFIAEIIDHLIIAVLFFPAQLMSIGIIDYLIKIKINYVDLNLDVIHFVIFSLTFLAVKSFYYYVLYRQKCTTLGKKLFHFRVYRANTQEPIGIIRIIFREVIGKFITILFLPLSLAIYIFDTKARFPHDYFGGTMVVEELEEHDGIDY